jgi:hypothetical protein
MQQFITVNLHSTINEKLQKYTDLKEELVRIWQLKTAHILRNTTSTIHNGYYSRNKKLYVIIRSTIMP